MKVLFVASGNKSVCRVSAFVQSQYDSLQKEGLDMMMYPVVGHGWKGYAKNLLSLRRLIKKGHPDVVHAHYSSCGYLATLASLGLNTKIVVSILGSFPKKSRKLKLVRFCVDHVWDATIVKSERTRSQLDRDLPVIPNGVDIDRFTIIEQEKAREIVGFDKDKKYDCTIYADAKDAHYETNPQAYTITKKVVKAGQTLKLQEAPGGGFAISLIAK